MAANAIVLFWFYIRGIYIYNLIFKDDKNSVQGIPIVLFNFYYIRGPPASLVANSSKKTMQEEFLWKNFWKFAKTVFSKRDNERKGKE